MGAIESAAPALDDAPNPSATPYTGLPFAAVGAEVRRKVSSLTGGVGEIPEGRTTPGNRIHQSPPDSVDQSLPPHFRQPTHRQARWDLRCEQRFTGVYIADPNHYRRVHDEAFHRSRAPSGKLVHHVCIEFDCQWLHTEIRQAWVFGLITSGKSIDETETTRIIESELAAAVEFEHHVVVLGIGHSGFGKGQSTGHPEMNHEHRAPIKIQEDVLPASACPEHPLTGDQSPELPRRHRKSQTSVSDHNLVHTAADQLGLKATPDGFYFGKFRHWQRRCHPTG